MQIGSSGGTVYLVHLSDNTLIECLDLTSGKLDSGRDKFGSEARIMGGHVEGTERYTWYDGMSGACCVWDLATRCSVRSTEFGE